MTVSADVRLIPNLQARVEQSITKYGEFSLLLMKCQQIEGIPRNYLLIKLVYPCLPFSSTNAPIYASIWDIFVVEVIFQYIQHVRHLRKNEHSVVFLLKQW